MICFIDRLNIGEGMRLALIVEDNAVNRELLSELLQSRGYAVAEASDGQEALEKIRERKPDVILLDLNMPVLDGFATLRKIRVDPQSAGLPVLAVTASAMRGDKEKALEAGFDGYLSKPIQSSVLYNEMDRILSKR
jgi:CheY-like chemotaxis protein